MVRDELTRFHQLIFDTDRGAWPPGTFEGWRPLQVQILQQKEKVRQLLDADRSTVGLRWSFKVEECLESGWQLLHNCFGQSTLGGPHVMKLSTEMPARRLAYYKAYMRVTGSPVPKHVQNP